MIFAVVWPFWDRISWREPVQFLALWLVTALVLFLTSRKVHGTLPTLMTIAIGRVGGFLVSLAFIFSPLLLLGDRAWDIVEVFAVDAFIHTRMALVTTIGGMCASWLSLTLFGPSVMCRRPLS